MFFLPRLKEDVWDGCVLVTSVNILKVSISLTLGFYGHYQSRIKHGYISQWILLKGCQNLKLHGLPINIVTNRDKVFTSHFWGELFKHLGTSLNLSTAYHPHLKAKLSEFYPTAILARRLILDAMKLFLKSLFIGKGFRLQTRSVTFLVGKQRRNNNCSIKENHSCTIEGSIVSQNDGVLFKLGIMQATQSDVVSPGGPTISNGSDASHPTVTI
ncbi:UNVERIFIED_CONTAM: hypothetical protein Slati_3651400 [Sesamum latifolium]|uniref:Integrase catalytic domain-containing protein n=1 Tax=Sesamum latifolium TaxID=2727402 RepID=A0AAW2U278_9LAMI